MIAKKTVPVALSEVSVGPFQALLAALTLAIGSSLGGNVLFVLGLPITLAGFVLACLAGVNWGKSERIAAGPWITAALASMASLGIIGPTTGGRLWYEVVKRTFAGVAIALVGLAGSSNRVWSRRAIVGMVSTAAVLFAIAPIGAPNPTIDVFAWTQSAVRALLHGVHPYTAVAPDVYRGRHDPGYTVSVYPYMPATLVVFAPWVAVLRDFRFALAAALILSIVVIHRLGRELRIGEALTSAAMLAVAVHPSSSSMIESGWNESLLVVGAVLFVFFSVRKPTGIAQASMFFLLPALKQYFVAPVILYLLTSVKKVPLRRIGIAIVISAATTVPFLVWNWRATLSGVLFQMSAPTIPRFESTSIVALVGSVWGVYPDRWMSAIVQMVVAALAWRRLARFGLSGLLLASALSLYATFLVGWQAFVNYYYFVGALLILAAMVRAAPVE